MYKLRPQNDYFRYAARAMLLTEYGADAQWEVIGKLIKSPLLSEQNKDILQKDYIKISFRRLRRSGKKLEKKIEEMRRKG